MIFMYMNGNVMQAFIYDSSPKGDFQSESTTYVFELLTINITAIQVKLEFHPMSNNNFKCHQYYLLKH